MRDIRDSTSDSWIHEFTGDTYGDMEPGEILESEINHILKSMRTDLEFPSLVKSNKTSIKNHFDKINGQMDMLENWFYIYAHYKKGVKTTFEEKSL